MINKFKAIFPNFIKSILNSYSQIFFSNNKIFAIILVIVTFFDVYAGISGVIAVIVSNTIAYLIGFNRFNIKSGYYGFNSLLVGLGIGVFYQPGIEFFLILLFTSVLTLFITVMFEGIIGKYGLPYLSIPFLLGIWMVTLASREFTALTISERGIYTLNEMYAIGGFSLVKIFNWFNNLNLHDSIIIYFKSLGAIFFQYHLFAGILIAIGVLIYSRISFLLTLVGFFSAYIFSQFVGADIRELSYSYIGFNYILTSIAIGGFFIVPSKYSFLWIILLTPLISITITSTVAILSLFQLSIFSLPFNFIVLMFLYILKFRERFYTKPEIVAIQQYSPEKNLYSQINNKERLSNLLYTQFYLPFWGEWKVTQGHYGDITHKNEWAHAWDFEICDENTFTYKGGGTLIEDYYAYNKPVIAPADGFVEEIIDGVDDNEIGDINLEQNWGNTIIIKHADNVYSKLCHLKKDSFKIKKGEKIKKGDILAYCGNSGRSPEPHIHFQIQSTPYIGSKTLDYPLAHYILNENSEFKLKSHDKPKKDDIISNIEKNISLYKAFHFIPGQKIEFSVSTSNHKKDRIVSWEVQTDIYNNSFIFCKKTKSKAYFKNDENIHYFTHFEGNKKSLLFYFYLGAYKVISGFYKNLIIQDNFPINTLNKGGLIFLQDFIAPFHIFLKSVFSLEYVKLEEDFTNSQILLKSKVEVKIGKKISHKLNFLIKISSNEITEFIINNKDYKIEAKRNE
ncbi:MAG: urea transporter [Bacteroidales bacterium]|nr:urea transporter [Bacteroidales bacterium]